MKAARFAFACCLALSLTGEKTLAQMRPTEAVETEKFERERELEDIRTTMERNLAEKARIEAEVAAIRTDRAKLIEAGIEAVKKLRDTEVRVDKAEKTLAANRQQEQTIKQSLEARRDVIAEVLAALQRMGRRPPPAILVAPGDVLASIRTAMLLGAVLPEMRQEVEQLAADLSRLTTLGKQIATDRDALTQELKTLQAERNKLDALTLARQQDMEKSQTSLDAEKLKALGLARQAGNLELLIRGMETEINAAIRAAEAARATQGKNTDKRQQMAASQNANRMSPALPFEEAKGKLILPVNGERLRDYGTPDEMGLLERGLSLKTRAGARVVAPADGWVVFAGPFRSYGQLLILNAGGGYHVIMSGMSRISAELGQFVLAGEPVAVMGQGAPASVIATGTTDPVLSVEFKKDGTNFDPGPWWAAPPEDAATSGVRNEKVRG